MTLTSIIFFLVFNIFTSVCLACLLNLFSLKITFKILFNILIFIIFKALILILLGIDFLGIVYIIVYAGAILILFLSVLMLIDLRSEEIKDMVDTEKKTLLEEQTSLFLKTFAVFTYFFSNIYLYVTAFAFYDPLLDELQNNVWYKIFNLRNMIYWVSEILYKQEILLFLIVGLIFLLVMVGSVGLILHESKPKTKWSQVSLGKVNLSERPVKDVSYVKKN